MQKQEISLGVDARCISGNITVKPIEEIYFKRKVRCHNRQIHKAKILKKE